MGHSLVDEYGCAGSVGVGGEERHVAGVFGYKRFAESGTGDTFDGKKRATSQFPKFLYSF